MKRSTPPVHDPLLSSDIAQGPVLPPQSKKPRTKPTPATPPSVYAPGPSPMVESPDGLLTGAAMYAALNALVQVVTRQTEKLEEYLDLQRPRRPLQSSEPLAQLYETCWTRQQFPPTVLSEDSLGSAELTQGFESSDTAERAEQRKFSGLKLYELDEKLPFMAGTEGYLLIRESYEPICDSVLNREITGHIVAGQPGIGKTLLLLYILIQLLVNQKPVLLCSLRHFAYLFDNSGVFRVPLAALSPDSCDTIKAPSNTIVLMDNDYSNDVPPPFLYEKNFVYAASPDHDKSKYFAERVRNVSRTVLDVFKTNELIGWSAYSVCSTPPSLTLPCSARCLRRFTDHDMYKAAKNEDEKDAMLLHLVQEHMQIVGPVARHVLAGEQDFERFKNQQSRSLGDLNKKQIIRLLDNQLLTDGSVSHTLILVWPSLKDSSLERYSVISPYGASMLRIGLKKLRDTSVSEMGLLLCSSNRTRQLGGCVYEEHAHMELTKGKHNTLRVWAMKAALNANKNVVVTVTGDQMPLLLVKKMVISLYSEAVTEPADLAPRPSGATPLKIPVSCANPLFDSYFLDETNTLNFLSMTAAMKHSCSGRAMASILAKWPRKAFPRKIIWMVVPKYNKDSTLGPIVIPKTVKIMYNGTETDFPLEEEDVVDEYADDDEAVEETQAEVISGGVVSPESKNSAGPAADIDPSSITDPLILASQFEYRLVVIPWKYA
ncbi:hypothetical protein C8J56DRAFT_890474 [Mycena floridula]|nr:hypothetical protein C8J56DRAFT_890474 [Mycena floridula]